MKEKKIIVKFFLNGDESGTPYTQEFETEEAYQEWYEHMKKSAEIFYSSI